MWSTWEQEIQNEGRILPDRTNSFRFLTANPFQNEVNLHKMKEGYYQIEIISVHNSNSISNWAAQNSK
jgi:hypothetical protein